MSYLSIILEFAGINMHHAKYKTLGNNVLPINYNLLFEPDLKTFRSTCKEKIICLVKRPTRTIRLNAKEIDIKNVIIKSKNKKLQVKVIDYDELEEIRLLLDKEVNGRISIHIDSVCKNNDLMYGFYRSKYEVNGREKYLLTSQFEAANARAAFPCFDEPSFKATFDVSFIIDKNLQAISNMPVKIQKDLGGDKKLVAFHRSKPMSSYLLYLGVGEFDHTEGKVGTVKVRVLTTPGKRHLGRLPISYAKKFITYYERYFGVKYPLPKLDLIAIPDFAAGAMENWGAITFREIALLGDKSTAVSTKEGIAIVIAHEIAHQWFGDLVTMKWWDDLWLNESFAEIMGYKAVDSVFPKWRMGVQFTRDVTATAFSADALKSTHPINMRVVSPGEIESIFDRISYEKGASVLRMLEDYVGEEVFRRGLNRYLRAHAYANATKHDLWNAIQDAANESKEKMKVVEVIRAWINKPGHPIVHVRKAKNNFLLAQKRFMLLNDSEDLWPIPVHYTTPKETSSFLMEGKTCMLSVKDKWIKLNHGQRGFYRVKYDDDLLSELGGLIRSKRMSALDSWGIENDLFGFVRSGRIPVSDYLNFVKDYCIGGEYPLSSSVSSHINWLFIIGYESRFLNRVKRTSVLFHGDLLRRLGWRRKKNESNTDTALRSASIASLGIAGHRRTLERAVQLFNGYVRGSSNIEVNIRGAVYELAAWAGNKSTFDTLVERYKNEKVPDEQRRLLSAICSFRDPDLIRRALSFSLSKDVRLQDSTVAHGYVFSTPVGKGMAWDWCRSRWKELMRIYSSGTHMLRGEVENLSMVSDPKTKRDIQAFFANRDNIRDDIRMPLSQTLERIDANIRFMEKNPE